MSKFLKIIYITDIYIYMKLALMFVHFRLFCNLHPDFHGPVSIMGHSLGSIITFDVSLSILNLQSAITIFSWKQLLSKQQQRLPHL